MVRGKFRGRGFITIEELKELGLLPPPKRLKRGPVAIAECPERIPCDICVHSCPLNAISMETLNDIPKINWSKCIGCALCITACPGLAIFVIDASREDNVGYVTLPYEFKPDPKVGSNAILLSRDGKMLGYGRIVKLWRSNRTWAVTVEVPKDKVLEVRGIRIQEG